MYIYGGKIYGVKKNLLGLEALKKVVTFWYVNNVNMKRENIK